MPAQQDTLRQMDAAPLWDPTLAANTGWILDMICCLEIALESTTVDGNAQADIHTTEEMRAIVALTCILERSVYQEEHSMARRA